MTAGRVVVVALVVAGALAGCGNSGDRSPAVDGLPLAAGSKIVARIRQCDKGSNAYCALELVVVSDRFRSSDALVTGEHRLLRRSGWTADHAQTGDETAAESPGDKLRVTYATASGDLRDIEIGWIRRSHDVSLALSRTLFDRSPAMSMMLEIAS
jgi:hypothetical protein